jgi:hypothetical protein
VTKTWTDPILVSALLEELFGAGEVELRVLDWTIPAGRLAVRRPDTDRDRLDGGEGDRRRDRVGA